MPMSEKLTLLLDFRADGAIKGLNEVGRTSERELGKAEGNLKRFGLSATKVGVGMMAAAGVMGAALWKAGEAASDLNEATNVTGLVFGTASKDIEAFAETAADSLGMSKRAALEAASGFGGLLQNLGMTRGESIETSKSLTALASDLGSAFNSDPAEAITALGSALRGESEPIRRYNVFLDDASVKQRAVEMGLAATTNEVDKAAMMQARLNIIMEQTNRYQGDFASTADGAANAQRRMNAQMEDAKAAIGDAALPVMQDALGIVNGLVGGFNDLPEPIKQTASQALVLGTGFLAVGGAATTVVGKVATMADQFKKLREKAQVGGSGGIGSIVESLKGMGSAGIKGGAAMGLLTVAVTKYVSMMGEATQAGIDFAARVERDAFTSVTSFAELTAKIDATREGADRLRESQSGGPIGSIIDSDYNRELQSGAANLDVLAGKYDVIRQRAEWLAAAQGISADSATTWLIQQQALGIEFESTGAAIEAFRLDTGEVTAAVDAQILSVDELKKSIKGYYDELYATQNAQIAFESSVDSTIEALKESGINYDLTTEAGRRNAQNVQDLTQNITDLYMAKYEETHSTEAARLAALGHAASLRQQMLDAGLSSAAVNDLVSKLDLADNFDNIETQFNMNGAAEAVAQVGTLDSLLRNLPLDKQITIKATVDQTWAAVQSTFGGDRAAGGPVSADKTYLVGEKGPELLTMGGSGGSITPNSAMGGGSITINVNAGLGADGKLIGQQIHEELKKYERAGGPALAVA